MDLDEISCNFHVIFFGGGPEPPVFPLLMMIVQTNLVLRNKLDGQFYN